MVYRENNMDVSSVYSLPECGRSARTEEDRNVGLKRSLRFLGVTVVMATLLAFVAIAPVAADTPGATLKPDTTSIKQRVILSDGTNSGGTVQFVGNGFGPGEIVSIYITFPDGRVFPVVNLNGVANPPNCCPQTDEVLADGTGSFFFRPVVMLFWWVTSAITRSPPAHYAVNIALHVANGLLVLALLRRMKVSFVPAALAGLAFVAHVTTYSAAAWLSDRFDLFTLAFGLGALIAVQIAHERG